jgi:hypothetical protein
MSDISQLASRVGGGEGEWGNKLSISLHYLAHGEGQGEGLRSLPLGTISFPYFLQRQLAILLHIFLLISHEVTVINVCLSSRLANEKTRTKECAI